MNTHSTSSESSQRSPWSYFRTDWVWLLVGAVASVVGASIQLSGFPKGLLLQLQEPLTYKGDGMSHLWITKRAMEDWYLSSPYTGYPFGSDFYDYPLSDTGNILLLKVFGLVTGSVYGGYNLFFYLGFAAVFVAAYVAFRYFGLGRSYAAAAAVLFNFLPFHFYRIDHLFYTWYFIVPVSFLLGYWIMTRSEPLGWRGKKLLNLAGVFVVGIVLGSFGFYYAAFAMMLFGIALAMGALLTKSWRPLVAGSIAIGGVGFGVILNLLPNLWYWMRNGVSPEPVMRTFGEAEIFAGKLTYLVLPRFGHRIDWFADMAHQYLSQSYGINESSMSTLGLVASIGFALGLVVLIAGTLGWRVDRRVAFHSVMLAAFFLIGTVGGISALITLFFVPEIRSWNRVSVFIAFGALFVAFFALQKLGSWLELRRKSANRLRFLSSIAVVPALLAGSFGILDLTVSPMPSCASTKGNQVQCSDDQAQYRADKQLVRSIEESVPRGSAVFQLPYMRFPESSIPGMGAYTLFGGYLNSDHLRWSFGTQWGRANSYYFAALDTQPLSDQLEVARKMGFVGVWVDFRGYKDKEGTRQELTRVMGAGPTFEREDRDVAFYAYKNPESVDLAGRSIEEIGKVTGFAADHLGHRTERTLAQGIDFTKPETPTFVKDLTGARSFEFGIRWADADIARSMKIEFQEPLPSKFVLEFVARTAIDRNNGPMKIQIGSKQYQADVTYGLQTFRIPVDLGTESVSTIEFTPYKSVSIQGYYEGHEWRRLGVGFTSMRFLTNQPDTEQSVAPFVEASESPEVAG